MKLRTLSGAIALTGATVFATHAVVSQDKQTTTKPDTAARGEQPTSADAESQIEIWARYAMPGKRHRLLDQMAGNWDTAATYWMNADSPPVQSKGSCERKWILDGRFLFEEFDGGMLGLPFRGVGLYGYDAFEQKYTSAWVDTTSTAIMNNLGVYDEPNNLVNFVGHYGDPWTGIKKPSRGLTRFVNKDKHVLELYTHAPDGREYKILEIVYTRKVVKQEDARSGAARKIPPQKPNRPTLTRAAS
ncbi:MAG: DUF1579 domain-containing protein [Phycisphaerae bacterium]|nr:DUF1579 domain-containing protein [Phycisphaerae bacterium]